MRIISAAFVLLCATHVSAAELTTLSGKKLTGDISAISSQGVTIKTADGDVVTPIAEVLLVELAADSPSRDKFIEVELVDGTVLACTDVSLNGDRVELTLTSGPTVQAPLAAVRSLLQDAHSASVRQKWNQMLRERGPLDLLVLRSEGKLDALDGTFGAGVGDGIEFTLNSNEQKLTPKLSRLQGLIFVRKPDPNAPPVFCRVVDLAGNVIIAKSVQIDESAVSIESVSGATTKYAALNKLARLDFSKGKLSYLSDLDPIEKDETSTEDLVFPYRRDRNLYGGPLRLKGETYSKGLALHSRTVLTYDLGSEYQLFRAVLGVDDVVRSENGAAVYVKVIIEADGRELFRGDVRSKDDPKPLALDVKNVRRLRISVVSPLLDLGNQVDLCDARVSK
jgi:hypothetical protein